MRRFDLAIFALVALSSQRRFFANGLSCYACGSIESTPERCVTETGKPSDCDKRFCTIYRREYLDPARSIDNFYRSCEDRPNYLNAVIESRNYRTYYRACDENLCNVGDGIAPFERPVTFANSTSGDILVVPGTGSSDERPFVSICTLFVSFFISFELLS